MLISRVLHPITTLGPGERLAIWTIGCTKRCMHCANPDLWNIDYSRDVNIYEFIESIEAALGNNKVDGVTITGGDPLEQVAELNILLSNLRYITDDILVFTGYTLDEVQSELSSDDYKTLIDNVSVLVTGRYVDDLNDNTCPLRGSSNQQLVFFDESKKSIYRDYLNRNRIIQNVYIGSRMLSVGIHNKGQKGRG
jgi:anaerobic ribonucleoside-triphosphate reductase activating protein